jgi:hypothetical protein
MAKVWSMLHKITRQTQDGQLKFNLRVLEVDSSPVAFAKHANTRHLDQWRAVDIPVRGQFPWLCYILLLFNVCLCLYLALDREHLPPLALKTGGFGRFSMD